MAASTEERGDGGGQRRVADKVDLREQLQNEGRIGHVKEVQLSEARIKRLLGSVFDLDYQQYKVGGIVRRQYGSSDLFYEKVLKRWIGRNEILKHLQIRDTGNNIHGILKFCEPVEICNDYDRERWALVIKVIQAALPIDPGQPGITALTRPIGSVNSKTGREVRLLVEGAPVSADEVLELFRQMCDQPFAVVGKMLFGTEKVKPCPICKSEDSTLSIGARAGVCYVCQKVPLAKLYDLVLKPKANEVPVENSTSDKDGDHA